MSESCSFILCSAYLKYTYSTLLNSNMGAVVSRVKVLSIAVRQVLELSKSYEQVLKRIQESPGVPLPNATLPFWHDVSAPVANHQDPLPKYADVIIIGSGITGASVARTLLDESQGNLKVVILEARGACSGATGRSVAIYLAAVGFVSQT